MLSFLTILLLGNSFWLSHICQSYASILTYNRGLIDPGSKSATYQYEIILWPVITIWNLIVIVQAKSLYSFLVYKRGLFELLNSYYPPLFPTEPNTWQEYAYSSSNYNTIIQINILRKNSTIKIYINIIFAIRVIKNLFKILWLQDNKKKNKIEWHQWNKKNSRIMWDNFVYTEIIYEEKT